MRVQICPSSLIRYALLSAIRDRIVVSIFAIIAICISLSLFFASAALTEKEAFVLVYSSGSIRIFSVVGLVLFIVFYIRRSFDSRDVDYLLSRPISRVSFVLSHILAFTVISIGFALLSVLAVLPLMVQTYQGVTPHLPSFSLWGVSLMMEYIIMACAAMFFSMVISSAASGTIVTLAFYILARMNGQFLNIVTTYKGGSQAYDDGLNVIGQLMQAISLFIPRLDLMGQSAWLIYDTSFDISYGYVIIHGCIFIGILTTATIIDLVKRQF